MRPSFPPNTPSLPARGGAGASHGRRAPSSPSKGLRAVVIAIWAGASIAVALVAYLAIAGSLTSGAADTHRMALDGGSGSVSLRRFTTPAGTFAAALPGGPSLKQPRGGSGSVAMYLSEPHAHATYGAGAGELAADVSVADPAARLHEGVMNVLASVHAATRRERSSTMQGFPAVDFTGSRADGAALRGRLVLVGHALFEVLAAGSSLDRRTEEDLFMTFRVVAAPGQQSLGKGIVAPTAAGQPGTAVG